MGRTKKELQEIEQQFYTIQDKYLDTGDNKYFQQMWLIMQEAIQASIKKKLKGIYRSDVHDLVLDATIQVMNRYKKPEGYKTNNLLTVAHWAAVSVLYNKKQQQLDTELSYEQWLSYEYAKEHI